MILICQNLRNNLQHPNEYIRGVTLRFLCRIHEEELLEPLIPSVIANLEHRHSYVRKNAVLALAAIYRLPKGELLVPDAPELVQKLLNAEQDLSTRRNAFQMLCNHAQDRAAAYLFENIDRLVDWGDVLQIAVLDLIRKVCRAQPEAKGRYIKIILALLQSRSTAVVYECATTLVSLSSAPSAIRAAATCFCNLLITQSDNNVKLIVLDRLAELKERHRDVMTELLMDILRALAAPNLDVRKKVLDVALDLVSPRAVDEVIGVLKKEAVKTQQGRDMERALEYRSLLVNAIHDCAVRFPNVASSVLHLLMDFLTDSNAASALDVAHFIREIVETNPNLHGDIVERLMDTFPSVRSSRVAASLLWIISEYCTTEDEIKNALDMIRSCLGPMPLMRKGGDGDEDGKSNGNGDEAVDNKIPTSVARPVVLADGSYATQTALPSASTGQQMEVGLVVEETNGTGPSLRSLLISGDFFLGAVLAAAFAKMGLRLVQLARESQLGGMSRADVNRLVAQLALIITNIVRYGQECEEHGASSGYPSSSPMDLDSRDRMMACIQVLLQPESADAKVWLQGCNASFKTYLAEKRLRDAEAAKVEAAAKIAQPDEVIALPSYLKHSRPKTSASGQQLIQGGSPEEEDIAAATGLSLTMQRGDGQSSARSGGSALSKVVQLTGFSDAIYAEAYVTAHRYDIVLDVLVINRTNETMQNVTLELATMGDLKLVERPQAYTLAAGAQQYIQANIKVSSTETGAIFGNLVYESTGRSDRTVVVLSDIHIDIMDYIVPATCPDVQFRSMWAEFEWENKVAINTSITDPHAFLDHIIACTNMRCLTPPSALEGDCGFLAANLYARSVFGEDALVNVSVEQLPDGKLGGYIRIRSKTQGIALSLGDKLIIKSRA